MKAEGTGVIGRQRKETSTSDGEPSTGSSIGVPASHTCIQNVDRLPETVPDGAMWSAASLGLVASKTTLGPGAGGSTCDTVLNHPLQGDGKDCSCVNQGTRLVEKSSCFVTRMRAAAVSARADIQAFDPTVDGSCRKTCRRCPIFKWDSMQRS